MLSKHCQIFLLLVLFSDFNAPAHSHAWLPWQLANVAIISCQPDCNGKWKCELWAVPFQPFSSPWETKAHWSAACIQPLPSIPLCKLAPPTSAKPPHNIIFTTANRSNWGRTVAVQWHIYHRIRITRHAFFPFLKRRRRLLWGTFYLYWKIWEWT